MAQKVTINGVEKEITAGFTTVGGVKKEITKGITTINGVKQEISFIKNLRITITGDTDSSYAFMRLITTDLEVIYLNEVGVYEFDNVFNITIFADVYDEFDGYGIYLNGNHLSKTNYTISTESDEVILTGSMSVDFTMTQIGSSTSRNKSYRADITYSASKAQNNLRYCILLYDVMPGSDTSIGVYNSLGGYTMLPADYPGPYWTDQNVQIEVTGQKAGYKSYTTSFNGTSGDLGSPIKIDCFVGRIYKVDFKRISATSGVFTYTGYSPVIYDDTYIKWSS